MHYDVFALAPGDGNFGKIGTRAGVVADEVIDWQQQQFPGATIESTAKHLMKEITTELQDPPDRLELADIWMLAICVVDRPMQLAARHNAAILQAVQDKLAINKQRTWNPPGPEGFAEHDRTIPDKEPT